MLSVAIKPIFVIVIILSVIMLSVIMQIVILLNVIAPKVWLDAPMPIWVINLMTFASIQKTSNELLEITLVVSVLYLRLNL